MTICNILQTFGIFYDHLVHFVFIWYIFPGFGIMSQEKSGNPALNKLFPRFVICARATSLLLKTESKPLKEMWRFFSATDGLRGCPFARSNHLSASGLPDGIYIFIPKMLIFCTFYWSWDGKFWCFSWPFKLLFWYMYICCAYMAIWYFCGHFGIFSPILVCCTKKNLATLIAILFLLAASVLDSQGRQGVHAKCSSFVSM
jgi:hypothetical protein